MTFNQPWTQPLRTAEVQYSADVTREGLLNAGQGGGDFMRMFRVLLASLLMLALLIVGAPGTSQASVTSITCTSEGEIRTSETYGTISLYGAQCAHSLDVTVYATLWREGKKVDSGSKTCKNTKQNQYCQSHLLAHNPKGKQKFKLVVRSVFSHKNKSAKTEVKSSHVVRM